MSAHPTLPLADVIFIQDFAAFCRTKGDEAYDYGDNCNCAVARFLRDTGRASDPWVGGDGWNGAGIPGDESIQLPEAVADAVVCEISRDENFSALADRLEALLVDSPAVVSQS